MAEFDLRGRISTTCLSTSFHCKLAQAPVVSATDAMLSLHLQRLCARSPLRLSARAYSARPPLPPLPHPDEWRKLFPYVTVTRRDRVFVQSPQAARTIAQSLFKSTPTGSGKGKVVVEAFPGACHLLPSSLACIHHPLRTRCSLSGPPRIARVDRAQAHHSRG